MNTKKARVMVVEDDPFFTRILEDALAPLDLDLVCVTSAEEALASSADHLPDLVVADYILPGRNGFDLLTELGVMRGAPKRLLVTSGSRLPTRWGQDIPVLFKPFATSTVRRLVGDLLQAA